MLPDQIKKFIAALGSNPHLIDELGQARNPTDVKALMVKHGILHANDPFAVKHEFTKEMLSLVRASVAAQPPQPGGRMVEWVGAVGQLAGAVAAGFCAA